MTKTCIDTRTGLVNMALVALLALGCSSSPASSPRANVTGRLPPEDIQRVVRSKFPLIQGCYDDGLRKDGGIKGRVLVEFVIQRDGAATSVRLGLSAMHAPEVESCLVEVFKTMRFPPPEGGTVSVDYPLVFSPD